jgi:hypothetical protein
MIKKNTYKTRGNMKKEYRFTFKNGWSCIAPNLDIAMVAYKADHGCFGIVCKMEKA